MKHKNTKFLTQMYMAPIPGQKQTSPEVPSGAPAEKSPGEKADAVKAEASKREALKNWVEKNKGAKERESLQEKLYVDRGTVDSVNKLNLELPPSPEQQKSFESFQSVLATLPQSLMRAGVKEGELLVAGKEALDPNVISRLNAAELTALKKIDEMRKFPEHAYSKLFFQKWPEVIETAKKSTAIAQEIVQKGNGKGTPEEKSMGARAVELMKAHPYITAGLVVGGAVGAYHLINKFFFKDDHEKDKDEDSTAWKWTKRALLMAGITVGTGSLLEIGGVKKFAKETLHIDVETNRIYKALTYLSIQNFNLKKFFETLFEGDAKSQAYKKMAEKISGEMGQNVSPELIGALSKESFEDFDSPVGKASGIAKGYLGKLKESAIPGFLKFFMSDGEEKFPEEEKVLRAYLDKHRDKINQMPKNKLTKVADVLAYLTGDAKTLEQAKVETNPDLKQKLGNFDAVTQTIQNPEKKQVAEAIRGSILSVNTNKAAIAVIMERANKRGIKTEDLQKLYAQTEEQHGKVLELMANPAIDADTLANQGDEYIKAIDEFNAEQADILDQLAYHEGWNELQYLGFVQGLNIVRGYIKLPHMARDWVRAKGAAAAMFPLKVVKRGAETVAGKVAPVAMAERGATQAAESVEEITRNMEAKGIKDTLEIEDIRKNGLTPELKTKIEARGGIKGDELEEIASDLHAAQMQANVKDLGHKIAAHESELKTLRATKTPDAATAQRINQLEQEVKGFRETMEATEAKFHVAKTKSLGQRIRSRRLEADRINVYDKENLELHWKRLGEFQDEIAESQKVFEREMAKKASRIAEIRKVAGSGSAQELAVKAEMEQLMKDFGHGTKQLALETSAAAGILGKWKTRLFGTLGAKAAETEYHQELKSFSKILGKAMKRQGTFSKGNEAFGQLAAGNKWTKIAFYTVAIGAGTALQVDEAQDVGVGKALKQTIADVAPVTGEISDFYSAITGKEYFTERKLDWTDRGIRATFGVAGTLVDVASAAGIFFSGGLATPLAAWARGGLGTFKAAKLARGAGVAIKEAELIAQGVKVASRGERLAAGAGKLGSRMRLAATGGVLGMIGYNVIANKEEVPVEPEGQQVLADAEKLVEQEAAGEAPVAVAK